MDNYERAVIYYENQSTVLSYIYVQRIGFSPLVNEIFSIEEHLFFAANKTFASVPHYLSELGSA